jgi:DNA-binding response OmpR family regulator
MGKIVMISAQPAEVIQRAAQECGADGSVRKPISLQELTNQVELLRLDERCRSW